MDELIADKKRDFIPASPVLWAFDPIIAAFTRESTWRGALLEQLEPGNSDTIADLGCGTGSFLVLVGGQAPSSKLIGIDPDAAVLARARAKLESAGVPVELRQGYVKDAARLLAGASVNKIVSSLVFHHLTIGEKRAAMEALFAALPAGGELHIADFTMRLVYRIIEAFAGDGNTRVNGDILPPLMGEAGFVGVRETRVIPTVIGSISLYRGTRPRNLLACGESSEHAYEMPRRGRVDGMGPKVREANEHLDTVGRNVLLPKVVWPDVQPSLRSRLMDHLVLLTGRKKWWASDAVVQERARRLALRPAPHRPVRLGRNVTVNLRFAEGWPVYHVEPARSGSARHHVIFLHGGAYIHEIVGSHWSFIGYLVDETNTHCVVPIYPLAPRGTAKEVVPATGRMLRELIEAVGAQNVTVIGNSAGGGLSLAAAQWLREAGHPQPNALILICPGVNGTLNQCTQADAARDVMQDVPGMVEAFRMYASDLDVTHPFVSPLNGNFDGLAPMLIFSGTHDLYHPDIVTLANTAARAGVPVEMHVRNGLPHNYPLLPTPEGREAREIIARAVAGSASRAGREVATAGSAKSSSGVVELGR
jgi:acetyl esterase/lipase/precorrin-6B methylase 2